MPGVAASGIMFDNADLDKGRVKGREVEEGEGRWKVEGGTAGMPKARSL